MLAETSIYRRKKQLGFGSRFVTMSPGQPPLSLKSKDGDGHLSGPVVASYSRGWAQQGGSGHSMDSLAESNGLQAPDGQPMWWGRTGVPGSPEQGQSRSFARGGKAFPLS